MATVTQITAGLVRKVPQPQLGPYHMVEIPTVWTITLVEGEDPMAVELEMRQMISEVHKQIAMPFIKAAMGTASTSCQTRKEPVIDEDEHDKGEH